MEEAYGRDHPETARALWGLDNVAAETGCIRKAREYLEEALSVLQALRPAHHPRVGDLGAQVEALRDRPEIPAWTP